MPKACITGMSCSRKRLPRRVGNWQRLKRLTFLFFLFFFFFLSFFLFSFPSLSPSFQAGVAAGHPDYDSFVKAIEEAQVGKKNYKINSRLEDDKGFIERKIKYAKVDFCFLFCFFFSFFFQLFSFSRAKEFDSWTGWKNLTKK